MPQTKPITITVENNDRSISLQVPRDSDLHEWVDTFNVILKWMTFWMDISTLIEDASNECVSNNLTSKEYEYIYHALPDEYNETVYNSIIWKIEQHVDTESHNMFNRE